MNASVRSEGVDPSVLSSRHVFRGIEYVVTLMIDNDKEIFVLEVEDRLTSDQWRGQFDARCKFRETNAVEPTCTCSTTVHVSFFGLITFNLLRPSLHTL